jgi:hypothetical protein
MCWGEEEVYDALRQRSALTVLLLICAWLNIVLQVLGRVSNTAWLGKGDSS